jgi:hypothetical protein
MLVPTCFIIGADKGGVGKTLTTRALLGYLASKGVTPRVFDTQIPDGNLKRFHPEAHMVDISVQTGQMKVFDAIYGAGVTVVDSRAGIMSKMLIDLRNIGLLQEAAENKIKLVVLHILDSNIASLSEISATAGILAGCGQHILVKNHTNDGPSFFEWDRATQDSYFKAIDPAAVIELPFLDNMSREAVEKEGVPFATFIAGTEVDGGRSRVLRGYVRYWFNRVCDRFDAAGITKTILQELSAAIQK